MRQPLAEALQLPFGKYRARLGKLYLGPAGAAYFTALVMAELQPLATALQIKRLADLSSSDELPIDARF